MDETHRNWDFCIFGWGKLLTNPASITAENDKKYKIDILITQIKTVRTDAITSHIMI